MSNGSIVLSTDVVTQRIGEELVVCNFMNEEYISFNGIGAEIWEQLEQQRTEADIVTSLAATFSVDRATIAADVESFIVQLHELGLARRTV